MNAREPFVPTEPVLVAGEGDDECSFVVELCRQYSLAGVQAFPYDGRDSLPDFQAAAQPQLRRIRTLVVLRDSDGDAKGAFASVAGCLERARLPVPSEHGVVADGAPSTAIWMLPDEHRGGTLETACWDALLDDPERPCVEQFITCIEKSRGSRVADPFKAPIRARLATRERAETRVGVAAKLGSLPLGSKSFAPLAEFLRKVVSSAGATTGA